ncbi:MAG: hypothetical protein A2W05_11810 [Candidatus Schekmanbacteria bacterium RBG_16_38_10]|uniref:Uncharacterized protein n=1 Tax=Candidatus Schekmanbacteria bacterium RBG_16_38_10 TaxID=1817879 RepID=A0A1F7RXY4_9BACT|nr:MAG: hypothetical protein A2W05_11810 [Candidatus Schekmanbacteria bacterium RBG_16_38_10]
MTVKVKSIDAHVRSIEEELKALKTLVKHYPRGKKERKTFASLKGIWKGKIHFTMDEIKEAEIKIKGF